MRYPTEVNLIGDSAEVLRRLLPLLEPKDNPDWRERIELNVRKWWRALEAKAMQPANPVNPQRIFCWQSSSMLLPAPRTSFAAPPPRLGGTTC